MSSAWVTRFPTLCKSRSPVSFQLCNDYECFLPERIEATLSCALDRLVEPEGLSIYADRVEAIEAETGKPVR